MSSSIPRRSYENLLLFGAGLVGLLLVLILYPLVEPAATLGLTIDRGEAYTIAERFVERFGDAEHAYVERNATLHVDNEGLAYEQINEATVSEQALFVLYRPKAYWDVIYRDPTANDLIRIKIGAAGNVFSVMRTPDDAMPSASMERLDAMRRARVLLENRLDIDWANYELVDGQRIQQDNRVDYKFTWQRLGSVVGGAHVRLQATVIGNQVGGWNFDMELPRAFETTFQQRQTQTNLFVIGRSILIVLVWLLSLVIFALRFRESELGIRNGLIFAVVLTILFAAFTFNTLSAIFHVGYTNPNSFAMFAAMLGLGLAAFFIGLGAFIVWVSGESMTRELRQGKLRVFDGLFKGHLFFKDLGRSLLRGTALGFIELAIVYGLTWGLLEWAANVWAVVSDSHSQALASFVPIGTSAMAGSVNAMLSTSYMVVFCFAWLKLRTKRAWLAVLLPGIAFGTFFTEIAVLHTHAYTAAIGALSGVLTLIFYLRYNVFTIFVGQLVSALLPYGFLFFYQPQAYFQAEGLVVLTLLSGLVVFGYLAYTRGYILDEKDVQPSYVQYIAERERLKMELDIARRSQLQMLPRSVPQAKGLDIAAFSEPAREVGGDYYDFIPLAPDKLGIAIGDVSGKGMPAALYMTMLKGFIQSRADAVTSAKDMLAHVNRKFYIAAERSIYVTLLYCIFDLTRTHVQFARAGHHPVLIYRPSTQTTFVLQPPGIGIGLESGPAFERITQQEGFDLQAGDVIVLYTDGLTEARDGKDGEFGEERLLDVIKQQNTDAPAEEILKAIRRAFKLFVGSSDPHDDLTCLVIKVQ